LFRENRFNDIFDQGEFSFDGFDPKKNLSIFDIFEYLFAVGRVNPSLIDTLKKSAIEDFDYSSNQKIYSCYGKEILVKYVLTIAEHRFCYFIKSYGYQFLIKHTDCAFVLIALVLEEPTSELIGEISLKDTFLSLPEITQNFTVAQLIKLRAIANQSPYWRQQDLSLFEQLLTAKLHGENKTYTFEQLRNFLLNIPKAERNYFSDWFPNLYQEIFVYNIATFSATELQTIKSIFLKAPNQSPLFSSEMIYAIDHGYERRKQVRRKPETIEQKQHQLIETPKWYRQSRIKLPFPLRFVLGTLAGFLLCFGLSVLMPWLAIPVVMFSIAAGCGALAIIMPYLLKRYERCFAQLFSKWDKWPSNPQQVFGQTFADLPSVARFFIGVFSGFAMGFSIGTVIFPGLGSVLGAAIGILVMTPLSLIYPALSIVCYYSIEAEPSKNQLNYLNGTPIYLRIFIGNLTGALIGAAIGSVIPGAGTLIGALIGTLVGGGLGCLAGLWPSSSKVSPKPDDTNWNQLMERKNVTTHQVSKLQSDYHPDLLPNLSPVSPETIKQNSISTNNLLASNNL